MPRCRSRLWHRAQSLDAFRKRVASWMKACMAMIWWYFVTTADRISCHLMRRCVSLSQYASRHPCIQIFISVGSPDGTDMLAHRMPSAKPACTSKSAAGTQASEAVLSFCRSAQVRLCICCFSQQAAKTLHGSCAISHHVCGTSAQGKLALVTFEQQCTLRYFCKLYIT